jgi:hypothetical protein
LELGLQEEEEAEEEVVVLTFVLNWLADLERM